MNAGWRRRRTVGVALVVVLGLLLTSTPSHAVGRADGRANSPAADRGERSRLETPHQPIRDFPDLPQRCYYAHQDLIKPRACLINAFDPARPSVVLWGDSHAQQYLAALRTAVRGRDVNLVTFVVGGCPAVGMTRDQAHQGRCLASNFHALEWVRDQRARHRDVKVIISSHFSGYRRTYQRVYVDQDAGPDEFTPYTQLMARLEHAYSPRLFTWLGELKVPTDVVGQSGVYPPDRLPCLAGDEPYRCDLPRDRVLPAEYDTRRWLQGQMTRLAGHPRYIDTSSAYCSQFVCHGEVGSIPTFFDRFHLSEQLTSTMARFFVPSIDDLR